MEPPYADTGRVALMQEAFLNPMVFPATRSFRPSNSLLATDAL